MEPTVLYFAYGSNLCLPRLRSRVPSVALVGTAVLSGYELRWHKRSTDTSGKCDVIAAPDPDRERDARERRFLAGR